MSAVAGSTHQRFTIQIRPIVSAIGMMLCALAAAMVLPALVDLADGQRDWWVFLASAMATLFIGGLMVLVAYQDEPPRLAVKDAFLLTTLSWVVVAAFGAIPFVGLGFGGADAFFEATSGLTTTGSTVIMDLNKMPRGVLLWRALLCGIGGLGIVLFAIIMLPFLRVGGMQLFYTERSGKSEKILPRASEIGIAIAVVYLGLMVLCGFVYLFLGMSAFDAVCHALATVSTAGFSTYDSSYAAFASPAIEWAAVVFMIAGSLPFVIMIKALRGSPEDLLFDAQVRGFLVFLLAVVSVICLWLTTTGNISFFEALRHSAFNVTSIVTTTGFISSDYTAWGQFSVGVFFLLMFVGGCSGSTTGAIKIYRFQVAAIMTRSYFLNLISPNRVVTLVYNGRRLPEDVPLSVIAFLAIYMTTVGIFSVILSAMGLDFVTSLSAAATALGNVGPGLGETIGPSGTFAPLPAAAKWVLSFAMLLGRLELFAVLVLFMREFWRS